MLSPTAPRLVAFVAGLLLALGAGGGVAAAQVVISEIHYHPAGDFGDTEFLELHNAGGVDVDLTGWCFDKGISYCFSGGSIVAGGELVGSPDAALFQSTYGFAPDFVYSGSLSNGGEQLRLVDGSVVTMDQVTYDDAAPWPVTPDGVGPSLELIDPLEDNDTPRNWRASIAPAGFTPRVANSVAASGLPAFVTGTANGGVTVATPVQVTATVVGETAVTLYYRIDFDPETGVAMADDGAHGDGAAADGVYGAEIPGQPLDTLVRYRIEAAGSNGPGADPRVDDTIVYYGAVLSSPITTDLPIVEWWIDPADFQAALDHYLTDDLEPAVLAYDGTVWDNVRVRVRGSTSREFPKKSWKFELPQGHDFVAPGLIPNSVDEFNLQASYSDKSHLRETLAFDTFEAAGVASPLAFPVRLQQNGAFFGLYTWLEHPDSDWADRVGLDPDGARYKAEGDCSDLALEDLELAYEKKSRKTEDYSDLADLLTGINQLAGDELHEFLFDNLDLPAEINYLAVQTLLHGNDHVAKNYYLYRDTEGSGRWRMTPWDLDLTFGRMYQGEVLNDEIFADVDVVDGRPDVSPSHPLFGDRFHQKWDFLWNRCIDAVLADETVREMYLRRLRTLMDALLAPPFYEDRLLELAPAIAPETALDVVQPWGQFGTPQALGDALAILEDDYLAPRRAHLFATHRVPGEIPAAQTVSAQLGIRLNELMYEPLAGDALEYVELVNPGDEAVDLSGWTIDGIGGAFPPGSVVPAGGYALAVADDPAFRAEYGPGRFLPLDYSGSLADGGEPIVLRNASGFEIDRVEYLPSAPWPPLAAGGGRSLALLHPGLPAADPASWRDSDEAGGTPGAPNFPVIYAADFEAGDVCTWSFAEGAAVCP